jgi:hypothetical protein
MTIIGVATAIGISLYRNGLRLSELGADRKVAAELAREALVTVREHPGDYTWPDAGPEPAPLTVTGGEDAWQAFGLPDALPTEPRARERERNALEKFAWRAFARGSGVAGVREVTVVVRWEAAGQTQSQALTALVPEPAGGDA